MKSSNNRQFDKLYESIFDGIRGAINSAKRGLIPGMGEEGNSETYLEYWNTFTKNVLRLIDNYDRNVTGDMEAYEGSEAKFAYERIMFLKKFLVNQGVSPWKYDKFDCSLLKDELEKNNKSKPKPEEVVREPEKPIEHNARNVTPQQQTKSQVKPQGQFSSSGRLPASYKSRQQNK